MKTKNDKLNFSHSTATHALGWVTTITLVCGSITTAAATPGYDSMLDDALSDVSQLLVNLCILAILVFGGGVAIILALIDRLSVHEKKLAALVDISAQAQTNGVVPNGGSCSTGIRFPRSFRNTRLPFIAKQHSEDEAACGTAATQSARTNPKRQFRVVLAKGLLPVIHQYVTEFLRVHGQDKEAGGMLVGNYRLDETCGAAKLQIQGFIDAGPEAEFSAGSILFDTEYQAQALRTLQMEHPRAVNVGCIHRHPGSIDFCSSGDAVTDREAVKNSDTKALLFAIITLNNPRQGPSSFLHKDFKIDFFVMAEETGFSYVPIQPMLADLPLLASSPVISALLALHGSSVAYDLAVLRQLPGLDKSSLCLVESGAGSGVCLNVSFKDAHETLHVWIQANGATYLFLKDKHGNKSILPGPWEHPETARHVWLSHLVLLARGQLAELQPTPGYGTHFSGLLHDKNRLVAEARAMQERYGNRATLRRRGDTLYWQYTVRESGRSFPIEVRYPVTYPSDPPEIFSLEPLPVSPHQLGRNKLCWIDVYSSHSDWNPSRDTAVVCIHAAHRWFACLLVYLTNDKWPESADH